MSPIFDFQSADGKLLNNLFDFFDKLGSLLFSRELFHAIRTQE